MSHIIASNMVRCSSCGCFVEYDLDKAPNLGKYGVIVNRVRKCVGGDVVVVRMDSIRYRLDIANIKYVDGERFHETIVKGPYCDIVSISDGEDLSEGSLRSRSLTLRISTRTLTLTSWLEELCVRSFSIRPAFFPTAFPNWNSNSRREDFEMEHNGRHSIPSARGDSKVEETKFDLKGYEGEFGILVNGLMKMLGGETLAILKKDICCQLCIYKFVEKDGVSKRVGVFSGPDILMADVDGIESFFRRTIEIMFIDTPEFNHDFDMMYLLAYSSRHFKLTDPYGLLSSSMDELKLKLTLKGCLP